MPRSPRSPAPRDPEALDNAAIARILSDVAVMLELTGANPFRARAFANAARAVESLTDDVRALVARDELRTVRGIGKSIHADIENLLAHGTFELYDELRRQVPEGVMEMFRVPGLGPKKIRAVVEKLGVRSIDELERAAREGRLASLPGFGAKTEAAIVEAIERLRAYGERHLVSEAMEAAEAMRAAVAGAPGVRRTLVAGSLRRRRETIGDIDILATADDAEAVMDAFAGADRVARVEARGPTKSTVVLESGIHVDLRVVHDDEFAFASHYFTGSKAHNTAVRARARRMGLRLNEYGLFAADDAPHPCEDEAQLFERLGLAYIPPELREDNGEIEAAEAGELPRLVEEDDIRGVFHCHSTWSDGRASLRAMAEAARELGLEYFGTGDHSRSAAYAGGLSIERLREQRVEVDALNREMAPFVIFHGVESDILSDGSLDYPDEVLAELDYVVASVHSQFTMSEAQMTERIVRAISNPYTTMLGHPTGRLLLMRDGYPVDLGAVIDAAAEHDVAIEINAHPRRLDLDWRWVRRAREAGVTIVVNPDAHEPGEIAAFRYGVGVARKGWLEKQHVLNTRTADEVRAWLAERRRRRGIE